MTPQTMSGREAACRAVTAALTGDRFVVEKLADLRGAARIEPREIAFAREIALGAVRHAVTIDHVLGSLARYDRRRVAVHLRALLYTAGYQLIWMSRVPPFAAVDQAVRLAGVIAKRHAAGMVNALLRRLSDRIAARHVPWQPRDPRLVRTGWDCACAFAEPVLPSPSESDDAAAFLAAAAGERESRLGEIIANHGLQQAEQVAWASQAIPVTVVHRNPLRIEVDAFEAELPAQLSERIECAGDTAFLPPSTRIIDSDLFSAGMFHVQDVTAQAAALRLATQPGESILDLCAAPGGKSIVIAQQMRNVGRVVAADVSAAGLARVRDNATRLGLGCIETRPADRVLLDVDSFDGAIVDVPCSNSGVIARRPEARLGLTAKKLASLERLQRDLLEKAAQCVRPGGRLVYSTCSIEPRENERLVEAFIETHPAWSLVSQDTTLPHWGPRLSDWRDGGYAALLRRITDPAALLSDARP